LYKAVYYNYEVIIVMVFKKVVVSTLSAGLVLSSIASLPLSSKGLLEKVGFVQTASAAVDGLSTITDEMNVVRSFLWTEQEKAAVRTARDNFKNLQNDDSNIDLVSEVSSKVALKDPSIDAFDTLKLFSGMGLFFNTSVTEATDALADPDVRIVLQKIAVAAGFTGGLDELAVKDAADFAVAVEASLKSQISGKSLIELAALALNEQSMKDVIKAAIKTVMDKTTEYKFSKALAGLGVTVDDIAAVTNKINANVDPDRAGSTSLALALLRSDATLTLVSGNLTNSTTAGYEFKILDKTVPTAALTWTSSNAAAITVSTDSATGRVILTMPESLEMATTTVSAKIKAPGTHLDGKDLYKQTITMNYDKPSRSGGGGGGGGGSSSSGNANVDRANDLTNQIKNATGEQKATLIAQLKKAVEDAVAQLSKIDVSSSIKVDGDTAKATLDVASVVNQIKQIAEQIKQLNDQLKAADPTAAPIKSTLTLDFGIQSAKTTEVTLPKAILDAAKDGGVSDISVKANGVGVKFKSTTFSSDTTVKLTKQDDSVAKTENNQRLVSGVVDVEFTSGNQKITNFSDPVELSLPVFNATGVDTEKLVVGKIVDGKIQPVGGKYNATDKQVSTNRNSFSIYTVIENNVTFEDIASVKAWAGRQIEVAAAKGILEGRAAGSFAPEGSVTRAEFAKMIVNTFGLQDDKATESFNDVNDSDWFKPFVASAVKAGLVNGREEGKFDPNGLITRAEMATIASRALTKANGVSNVKDVDAALKGFGDASQINASLKAGVALAVDQGIIVGDEGGKFNPNSDSTRAQAAVVIYRLLNK
jgi:hypothetical protein